MKHLFVLATLALWTISPLVAAAQQRPSLRARRIQFPIIVDGMLDDTAWTEAEVATGFVQREPREGEPASEDTEVSVVYTSSTLYFGIRALDSEPNAIIAKEMERDGSLGNDDSVLLVLDTFLDGRNSYAFSTNPNGARWDALVTDEGLNINQQWDGVWTVAARRGTRGWTAEIAIPFSTLRFDRSLDTWGFNVERWIRRRNEETHWVALPSQFR